MAITGTDAARVRSSEPAHSTLAAGSSDTTDEGTRQTGDAQASDAKAAAPKSTLKHAVEPGETLSEIAQRYQTNVATLAAANPEIDNVDRIELGRAVSVPLGPGYGTQATEATVEPGQTLSELARSYQTSVSQIHSASLRQPPRAAQCRPRGCRPDAVGPGQHERGAASRLGAGDGRRSRRRRVAGLRGEGRIGQQRPATGHLTRYAVGLCVRWRAGTGWRVVVRRITASGLRLPGVAGGDRAVRPGRPANAMEPAGRPAGRQRRRGQLGCARRRGEPLPATPRRPAPSRRSRHRRPASTDGTTLTPSIRSGRC